MQRLLHLCLAAAVAGIGWSSPLTLEVADFATLPITGLLDGTGQTAGLLARVVALRDEPGDRQRFFVADLNGPLYIFETRTQKWTTYLDFNGRGDRNGLFERLSYDVGFANGLNTIQFDPDYGRNGTFFTVHTEDPAVARPAIPDTTSVPDLRVSGYTTTPPIAIPGPIQRESVLIEWIDTDTSNSTFEGSAREVMRVQLNTRIHPMADLTFNPRARRGDPDWRVLYIGCGDGGSGEAAQPDTRLHPQRLDTLVGKILRIIPDRSEQVSTSVVSDNGRYRIPRDNPFTAKSGARGEVWALGFRNPHRLTWGPEPANPPLIANSIGLGTWETVNIVHKGANYGYSLREGTEALGVNNATTSRPAVDEIPVRLTSTVTDGVVTPTYPVLQYAHIEGAGDAIGSGFVYTGKRLPALAAQFVFGDISTGRIWRVPYAALLRADDGDPTTMASPEEMLIAWNDPNDRPDAGRRVYPTFFPIVQAAYRSRGGRDPDLPGRARVSGAGRADTQFAVDAAGELYVLSKSDGMIRRVISVF